mgnify:CR=1 FL=1
MQDPLKQGLKQQWVTHIRIYIQIRMQDPLKQGLKPVILLAFLYKFKFECKIH